MTTSRVRAELISAHGGRRCKQSLGFGKIDMNSTILKSMCGVLNAAPARQDRTAVTDLVDSDVLVEVTRATDAEFYGGGPNWRKPAAKPANSYATTRRAMASNSEMRSLQRLLWQPERCSGSAIANISDERYRLFLSSPLLRHGCPAHMKRRGQSAHFVIPIRGVTPISKLGISRHFRIVRSPRSRR
jgi:hypothetical protein